VCQELQNPNFKGKALLLAHFNPKDFEGFFRNQKIQVGEKVVDGAIVAQLKNKATVWLDHPLRKQYRKVEFVPNSDLGPEIRNLWHGFAYEPKKGDCSLYLKHLFDNVCQKEQIKYDYLIGWMAYAVRHPNEQGHAAIVIQGLKGVGKNVAAEGFAALWGQHALIVSDSSRITNNFNAHLRALCVLIADEAFFAGDRRHEGKLKSLVTSGVLDIEAKGVDVIQVPNLLHIMILGNDRWLVPASIDERRYLVLRCGEAHRGDQAYFEAIHKQLDSGGYSALLHYLLEEVNLKNFNVRNVPHTKELREQMVESLRDADKALFECLHTGMIPGRLQKDGTVLMRTGDLVDWANGRGRNGWGSIRPQHVDQLFGKEGMRFDRDNNLTQKSRFWKIPPLEKCRGIWNQLRGDYAWPEDGGIWEVINESSNF
jgi:hypothetical protein